MLDLTPDEVLVFIFNLLDNESLLNACLVNHAMNGIASRSLYRTLIVNKIEKRGRTRARGKRLRRDPFIAFQRLPGLRAAVRNVILYSSIVYALDEENTKGYTELVKLKNVRKISICGKISEAEMNIFLTAARELPLLKNMVYTAMTFQGNIGFTTTAAPTPKDLNQVHSFDLHIFWSTLPEWATNHIAGRIRSLKIEQIWDYEKVMSLETLSNLEDIALLMPHPDPVAICAYLGVARNLTRITIDVRWKKHETPTADPNAPDTGLTTLESLKLNLYSQQHESEIMALHGLIRSLASHSRLRKLAILSPGPCPPCMRKKCDRLVSHIPPAMQLRCTSSNFPSLTLRRRCFHKS
ncbi:hypothetical protein FRC14_004757 [Serendipita sp. 396]|nr:hypothetical protein FRC14_004757 [Serendipita sp. 396]KAG8789362.1 hypothetical protein FRC15_009414 [Serendipita sp. 397]KAG8834508.1 hypothetical protein FRC18_001923 [Serendipita sp. 400]KAG8878716.1 hypothetical protein FRC20_006393 [Serendipita sp. 405]